MLRSVRLLYVTIGLIILFIVFAFCYHQLDMQIKETNAQVKQSEIDLRHYKEQAVDLQNMLDIAGTDAFVEQKAREYGYMRKDELRFVITNPEILYGTDEIPKR